MQTPDKYVETKRAEPYVSVRLCFRVTVHSTQTGAVVRVGPVQHLAFVEGEETLPEEYDGHHICVYLTEEGGRRHHWLSAKKLYLTDSTNGVRCFSLWNRMRETINFGRCMACPAGPRFPCA